jgi:glutamate synthase domain-containing protein 2
VPDLAMTGGFSDETHAVKALAMGAPNFKAVCMGRAPMISGMVGKNSGEWIKTNQLPKTVSKLGTMVDEIFVSYEELKLKYGKDVEKLPLDAIGIYTASQKIRTGLQQLKDRTFNLSTIIRGDLMSLTEECEKVAGIPYVMRAYRKEAKKILAQEGLR